MEVIDPLKIALLEGDPGFWSALAQATRTAGSFSELLQLSTLRRRAARSLPPPLLQPLKLALLGSATFTPLRDLIEQVLFGLGFVADLHVGQFDAYHAEILDEQSAVYRFRPEISVVLPSARRCVYGGSMLDARDVVAAEVGRQADELGLEPNTARGRALRRAARQLRAAVALRPRPISREDPGVGMVLQEGGEPRARLALTVLFADRRSRTARRSRGPRLDA